MGLDNFWVMPDEPSLDGIEDEAARDAVQRQIDAMHPQFYPPLRLCGGLFSGNGFRSFRGKVYAGLIEAITERSIYEDYDNEHVRSIADKLEAWLLEHKDNVDDALSELEDDYGYSCPESEFRDLVRMFRTYADAGAELVAWY